MDAPWVYVLWGCAAYLLGSVSFGDIVARLAKFPIRETGTGNPGAANIFREIGPKYAAAVMALDLGKGMAATLPALLLDMSVWAGVAGTAGVLAGHFLPVFWGFRGGTGMVVAMGAGVGLIPLGVLIAAPIALVMVKLTKNAGYSGLLFFLVAAPAGWWFHDDAAGVIVTLAGAGAVLVKSRIQYRRASQGQPETTLRED